MPLMQEIPKDLVAGPKNGRYINPIACVDHKTSPGIPGFNDWPGAYSVGKNGVGFHFLVGKDEGQWVQLYDTTWLAWHVGEENPFAVGIEVCGEPGDAFTPWQTRAVHAIVQWLAGVGIPLVRYEGGPHTSQPGTFSGFIDHRSIIQSQQHEDYWNDADWVAVSDTTPPGPPIDWAAIAALVFAQLWQFEEEEAA